LSGDLVLALDVGTQSVRALVFDGDGNLLAGSRVPLVDYRSPRPVSNFVATFESATCGSPAVGRRVTRRCR